MAAASFGGSFNLVESDDSKQKEMFNTYLKRLAFDVQFPILKYLPFVPRATSSMAKIIGEIVSKRRVEMEKGVVKNDLLQIFVDTNNADPVMFSDKHIEVEMILFMWVISVISLLFNNRLISIRIAGSDTTSLTATFTLLLLLNNQEKLQELVSEIDATFPSMDDTITFAKTQDLPYLNAVINESMRILPIVTGGK